MGIADYNGDGKSDVLWRNVLDGRVGIWLMDWYHIQYVYPGTAALDWAIVGAGDYDGNRFADILWRHKITGEMRVWNLNSTATAIAGDTLWNIRMCDYRVVDYIQAPNGLTIINGDDTSRCVGCGGQGLTCCPPGQLVRWRPGLQQREVQFLRRPRTAVLPRQSVQRRHGVQGRSLRPVRRQWPGLLRRQRLRRRARL